MSTASNLFGGMSAFPSMTPPNDYSGYTSGVPVNRMDPVTPFSMLPSALTSFSGLSGAVAGDAGAPAPGAFNFDIGGLGGGVAGAKPRGAFGGLGTAGAINAGLSGLQTLGGLWMGLKQLSLAKKQFQFSKDFANTNLANSMKTYNTALGDRARSRGFTEGQSQATTDKYVADNRLAKSTGG